ncbi:hypothetical protein ACFWFF_12785 [Streptomyces sp. NPDC060223]
MSDAKKDQNLTTQDSHQPAPPTDGEITTLDSHQPAPPVLGLDNK